MDYLFWLGVAGDVGSALGGLTVFGAATGWVIRNRAENIENRRELALHLDQLYKETQAVQLGPQQRAGRSQLLEFFKTRTKLDTLAKGSAREIARYIEKLLLGLDLMVMQVYNVPGPTPPEVERAWNHMTFYLANVRHDLVADARTNFVKKMIQDEYLNQFHFDRVSEDLMSRDIEIRPSSTRGAEKDSPAHPDAG